MLQREAGLEEDPSKCSSGCVSGWTIYLGCYSREKTATDPRREGEEAREEEKDDDDSLSMASDASSGPPHALEDSYDHCHHQCSDNGSSHSASSPPFTAAATLLGKAGKKRRVEKEPPRQQETASASDYLDDTASSPFFGFSKRSFGISNGDICTSSSSSRTSVEAASEFSCGFSGTHLKDQRQREKIRVTSSTLL